MSQSRADTWVARAENLLARAENARGRVPIDNVFVENFFPNLVNSNRQEWCEESLDTYRRFLQENMLGSLQKAVDLIRQIQPEGRGSGV